MKLLPETFVALRRLGETSDRDFVSTMVRAGERLRLEVPSCVGFSYSLLGEHLTFTVVATDREVALLESAPTGEPCAPGTDVLDEVAWRELSTVASEHGVRSTLSMPVVEGGTLVGMVNVYAGLSAGFAGHEAKVAEILGASAPDGTANADLAFRSLAEASHAPRLLDDRREIDRAVGSIGSAAGIPLAVARTRLDRAAAQVGITSVQAARAVLRSRDR
ncbi:hypothetical protein [Cellulomonas sp. ICMP 17802]|uniref:hypothetical protein n=1 Tax=Cellulomonas sp. ICMP 17802 TaxID=3239199 RepID=UPI00351B47BC